MLQVNDSFRALPILENSPQGNNQRFLRFPLNGRVNGLLPLADLRGVIQVTLTEVLPVPQVAEFLLGIMNWRGEALWIIDLAALLGATHWCRRENVRNSGMAMLVQVQNQTVGLLVEQVNTIEVYDSQERLAISASMLPTRLKSFLQGYFMDAQGSPLMLVDTHAVIQALQSI
ncbi:chemotaxis protein CheW [Nostoc sp. FACHB-152]|uniref:chemotaxis protein CheW n=1 Tax=unclassified Nostoc TaxID=2593658 RepID=UPI001681DA53|nr:MULTISPECIES: chemotaxis protein CheW [unclassified Nostoc]MBD2451529.1 chemotaxis protein CheW [Nostoc sp. FACHB-152]MBD2467833.1 chemotaxis protein CheW [Nostoc sp. FACHB-145]